MPPAREASRASAAAPSGRHHRRVDCAYSGCAAGCASDKIAIAGFCAANTMATSTSDRKIDCIGGDKPAAPTVLICAKK